MESRRKSDEDFPAKRKTLDELLIECNFFKNLASYLVERSGRGIHYAE
jgi:hypothetical protein